MPSPSFDHVLHLLHVNIEKPATAGRHSVELHPNDFAHMHNYRAGHMLTLGHKQGV